MSDGYNLVQNDFDPKGYMFLQLRYVPSPFVREEENVYLRCAIAVFLLDVLLVFLSLSLTLSLSLSCRRQRVRRMQHTQQKDSCSFSFFGISADVSYAQWISTGQKLLVL